MIRGVLWFGAIVGGVGLASVHWLGIVIGGMLVGLLSETTFRGVASGAGFGLVVWAIFAGTMIADGAWEPFLATGEFVALSAAIAVGLGAFGGLARGLR